MDKQVIAAMSRWPDVPSVYGWLSLSSQGHWLLHPDGQTDAPGEPISNEQLVQFINRNYTHDNQGQWFFQNGPQRVYVALECAPYVVHTVGSGLQLRTHNHLDVTHIDAWYEDRSGRLYVLTEHGGALISGRDVPEVYEELLADPDDPLSRIQRCTDEQIPELLNFVVRPQPQPSSSHPAKPA